MARSFAAVLPWPPAGSLLAGLALFLSGCTDPVRAGATSTEQTAPDAAALAVDVQSPKEHFQRLGLTRWHARGWRGHGVKVAVFDSGFRGYRGFLDKGLP